MIITLRPDGHYQVKRVITTESGQERTLTTNLKTSLRTEAEDKVAEMLSGGKKNEPSVSDALRAWIEGHLVPKGTERVVTDRTIEAIADHFKKTTVAKLTDDMVRAYVKNRINGKWSDGKAIAEATVRKEVIQLQAALNYAIKRGTTKRQKPFNLDKPAQSQPRDLWMTEAQERKMIAECANMPLDVQLFVRMGLAYGARRQAMLDLVWDSVGFERGSIDFGRAGSVVTKKRRAEVPMTPAIRDLLLRHKAVSVTERVLNRNTPARYTAFAKSIGLGWVTPHVLKHTAITLLLRSGTDVSTVAKLCATSPRTLLSTYRHHGQDELLAAAGRNEA